MILIYTFVWCQVILTKRKVRLTNLLYYCKDIKLFDLQKEILIFYQRKMITKIAYIFSPPLICFISSAVKLCTESFK